MAALQVGDWVRTDKGVEGEIVFLSGKGRRAYVEIGQGTLGSAVVGFPVSTLTKIGPPKPLDATEGNH